MNTPAPTNTLPDAFGRDWVTAMIHTVLGTGSSSDGAATALGELDRRAGDGDFGTNLTSAFTRVTDEVSGSNPHTYTAWLTAVSRGFLGTGGTSGPLFGMFFRDLARCTDSPSPTVAELADGLTRGVATVQRYGKAAVGHKTMVDALAPASETLRAQVVSDQPGTDALAAAAAAAKDGALSTRDITARRGRASYVGDVAKGVLDPGAVAAALMIQCAAQAAEGNAGAVDASWSHS
ncbi:dihydroxyacetone kinase subunit DhaL [Tsukamurella soli]